MGNSIAKFKKYTDKLDEVYKLAAKTAVLDSDSSVVQVGANANEIIVPVLNMDGLGNYDRNSGYVDGSVTLTNETVRFNYDRGRKLSVDAMDNEETAGVAFGKLSSEFIRTKVVPEMDAVRFATYAAKAGHKEGVSGGFSDGNEALAAITEEMTRLDEAEVSESSRILFVTPTVYNMIMAIDSYKSKAVLDAFAAIVKVPQNRFYTEINLLNGKTSGEEIGGYAKSNDGKDILFMICEKSAILQYTKHNVNKVFTPDENQDADAYIFNYRAYGLNDVYGNKTAGITVRYTL